MGRNSRRRWGGLVVVEHRDLLPFFPDAPQHQLNDIVVQVTVATDRALPRDPHPADPRLAHLVTSGARWVVRGDPGSGKSTLAPHLAAELASSTEWTPVYVALATLLADGRDPLAWADATLCHGAGCAAGALEGRLAAEEAAHVRLRRATRLAAHSRGAEPADRVPGAPWCGVCGRLGERVGWS
jgi:hypothetical protein